MSMQDQSHRRKNLLTGEWVLVSPHRSQRPWQGDQSAPEPEPVMEHDPGCYLCPGNSRAGGVLNPDYTAPWAFDNDFPALSSQVEMSEDSGHMFQSHPVHGICRVLCFTPRHDQRLASLGDAELLDVFRFISEQFTELDRHPDLAYVQVFENRGRMMGCSNPHPHAQVWASSEVPDQPARELQQQAAWFRQNGRSLLLDYLQQELQSGERIVCENEHAVSLVPFWAEWPFETLVVPRTAAAGPGDLSEAGLADFARMVQASIRAGEAVFDNAMPYSLGFHPRPSDGQPHPEWQFHAHIFPPLLRSATVRKFKVGFEMLGMPQRDITPEAAATKLREAFRSFKT